jgi:Arabinose-binding domain of AraC transcription regulator, N-term
MTGTPRRPTRRQTDNEGSVRVGVLMPLADLLLGMRVDVAELLADVGLDPTVFDDADNRIAITVEHRLLALAARRSGCDHIGLLVGQRGGLQIFGLAGLLVRYSPDVQTGRTHFRALSANSRTGSKSRAGAVRNVATLSWQTFQPGVETAGQVGDAALAVMFNMMRELCGPDYVSGAN